MRKLHPGKRITTWLALAALFIQFAVSFGHVHIDGIRRVGSAPAAGRQTHTVQKLPADQPGDDGDDYCAICASIYLAANSVAPSPPVLPVPLFSTAIDHADRNAAVFVSARRPAFQSRAPPLA